MDPDDLTDLQEQIAAATVAALVSTAAAVHDMIDAEIARNLILTDLATVESLIYQFRVTPPARSNLTTPAFCLTPGQISPDLILKYTNKNDIEIYEKAINPFKMTFNGSISNMNIFIDNIM